MSKYRFGSARFEIAGGKTLGFNLGHEWQDVTFLDRAKTFGAWRAPNWAELDDHEDSLGYLASLPAGVTSALLMFSEGMPAGWTHLDGNYTLKWDGAATLTTPVGAGTSNLVEVSPSHYTMDVDFSGGGNRWFTFSGFDFGNPMRNLQFYKTGHQALIDAGEIYDPAFLAHIAGSKCLRVFDWQRVNGSPVTSWSELTTRAHRSWVKQSQGGVPVDMLVELCNKTGADGWFCLFHMADDDLITRYATYVRDNLDPELRAYFEYSNETWNGANDFDQTPWLADQAEAVWGTTDGSRALYYGAKMSTKMAKIVKGVFGKDQWHRCRTVMGTQTASTGVTVAKCIGSMWQTFEPDDYEDPRLWHDFLAIAGYYTNRYEIGDKATLQGWLDLGQANFTAEHIAVCEASYAYWSPFWETQRDLAASYGMSVCMYEGNQHSDMPAYDATTDAALIEAVITATRSAEQGALHQTMLAEMQRLGVGPLCMYVDRRQATKFGTWGLREHVADTNSADTAVRAWFANNPRWWTEPGLFNAYAPGDRMTGDITFRAGERISDVDTWRAGPATVTVEGQAAASATWPPQAATIWTGV